MINFSALASAVILKAYEDLTGPPVVTRYPPTKEARRRERWREDAKEFLSSANEDLLFWCVMGGLNMTAIVEKANKKADEPTGEKV